MEEKMRIWFDRLYEWWDGVNAGRWFAFCIVSGFLTSQIILYVLSKR